MIIGEVLLRHWCSERSGQVGVQVVAVRTGRHEWILLVRPKRLKQSLVNARIAYASTRRGSSPLTPFMSNTGAIGGKVVTINERWTDDGRGRESVEGEDDVAGMIHLPPLSPQRVRLQRAPSSGVLVDPTFTSIAS